MKFDDINETILHQLDPQVAITLIEAQSSNNILETINGTVAGLVIIGMFWVILKYTN